MLLECVLKTRKFQRLSGWGNGETKKSRDSQTSFRDKNLQFQTIFKNLLALYGIIVKHLGFSTSNCHLCGNALNTDSLSSCAQTSSM